MGSSVQRGGDSDRPPCGVGTVAGRTQDNSLAGVFLLGFVPSTVLLSKGKSSWGKCKVKSLSPWQGHLGTVSAKLVPV